MLSLSEFCSKYGNSDLGLSPLIIVIIDRNICVVNSDKKKYINFNQADWDNTLVNTLKQNPEF